MTEAGNAELSILSLVYDRGLCVLPEKNTRAEKGESLVNSSVWSVIEKISKCDDEGSVLERLKINAATTTASRRSLEQ